MIWLLAACDSLAPTWINERPACSAEPYAWSDDLVSWVSGGDGQGTFSFDPLGDARTSLSGAYDPHTGDFFYTVAYGEGYWLVESRVDEGFGTVWHSGDLDVEYVVEHTDVLEETWSTGHRVIREGCDQTWYTWSEDDEEPVYQAFKATFTKGEMLWTAEVDDAEWSGSFSEDGTRSEAYEGGGEDDSVVHHPDGTSDRSFHITTTDYEYVGNEFVDYDGSVSRAYDIDANGKTVCEVTESFDYAGEGTAQYECTSGDFECEYSLNEDGECRYECDDGQRGSC